MALCHRKPQTQSSTWQTLGNCRHTQSGFIMLKSVTSSNSGTVKWRIWKTNSSVKSLAQRKRSFLLFWIDSTWNLRARKEKVHTLYQLIKYDRAAAERVTGTASAYNAAQYILELIKMCSLRSLIITFECVLVIQLNNVCLHLMMYIKQFKNVHLLLKLWTDSAVGYQM